MIVVVGGPLATCWPRETSAILRATGLPCVCPNLYSGERASYVPIDQLLRTYLALAQRAPILLVQGNVVHDCALWGLTQDLARRLGVPSVAKKAVRLLVDPHETFEKVVNDSRWRARCFSDVLALTSAGVTFYGEAVPDVVDVAASASRHPDAVAADLKKALTP